MPLDLSNLGLTPTQLSALHVSLSIDAIPAIAEHFRLLLDNDNTVPQHSAGAMDQSCPHCAALFFGCEHLNCCSHGGVDLPLWRPPPEPLLSLLNDDQFRLKIRGYNCALSLGSSVFEDLTKDHGPATFKMAGRSWRLLPTSVNPSSGPKKFAQIYSMPVNEASDRRATLSTGVYRAPLRRDWLASLHSMLVVHNALVRSFVQSVDDGLDWQVTVGALEAAQPHAVAANETMIGLLVNGGGLRHSIVVPRYGEGSLIIVPDLDPYYQPLHFVLLFPYGDPQWGLHLNRINIDSRKRKRALPPVTIFDYLKFHLQRRSTTSASIHDYGRLFEEWFVDSFLQNENHKLQYLKNNQGRFRHDRYTAVQRQLYMGVPPRQIGSPATHLPSSFVRGCRYYRELYADAMTLPAHFGGIDFFLTFTTNPAWPEIANNSGISNGMNSPDLYCRVFYIKMKALLCDVIINGVLGVVVAYAWSVEFQQRGLPHLHACFIVRQEDKPHSPVIVDRVVAAQLPDASIDLPYFRAVSKHMMHGPCGVHNPSHYCMKHGQCRFDYPKRLQLTTTIPQDGYTKLARPFGCSVQLGEFQADNGWVVPHNRFLLLKYDAHINVECSASISVVKYMFSYIYKGTKSTSAAVHNARDEIQLFSDGRITSAAEAMWQVLGFETHKQLPTVQRLGCGLPNDPDVQFDGAQQPAEVDEVAANALDAPSHLKSWLSLNAIDAFARTLTYLEIPTHYVWDQSNRQWSRRKQKSRVLGRMYPVDPTNREAWALRVLLQHSRGCVSVEDIRTVCGEERATFWEAAVAAGLMEDDWEHHKCLRTNQLSPSSLRSVFLIIVTKCQPRDPMDLLNAFFGELTIDFAGNNQQKLASLYCYIMDNVDSPLDALGLDSPPDMHVNVVGNTAFLESFVSNPPVSHVEAALNVDQQCVHDAVLQDVVGEGGTIFVLTAPAGTGKTFVINQILATASRRNLRVVSCASSGLAASLLGHARTAHALFKIPVHVDEMSFCRPTAQYKAWLRSIDCFIWDEISMAHKWALDAVERMLRDIHEKDSPFGGKTVLFAGDMQQLLPVHRFARDPAAYCFKTCGWFCTTVPLHLTVNVRAAADHEWSEFVARVGKGSPALFPASCMVPDEDALIDAVWPDGNFMVQDQRSILTMTRDASASINQRVLGKFPGLPDFALSLDVAMVSCCCVCCKSAGDDEQDCETALYPVEFLHSCSLPGIPEHVVTLKKGAPYMCMHNTSSALCNGTRVIYHRRVGRCLEVEICSGERKGEYHYLPRLVLTAKTASLPFSLRRVQFPIQPCFAM